MEEIIIKVKNKNKVSLIKELLNDMPYIEVVTKEKISNQKKKKFLKDIDESVDFITDYDKGKIKAKSFNELMNEL